MGFKFEKIESVSIQLKEENDLLKTELEEVKKQNSNKAVAKKTKASK